MSGIGNAWFVIGDSRRAVNIVIVMYILCTYCVQAEAVLTELQPLLSSPSDITVTYGFSAIMHYY